MSNLDKKILDLIKRDPGELAFVVDTDNYESYIQTYLDAHATKEDAVYNEDEYEKLKNYFK